ncbi:MAG: ATP-binding protein [Polyangiaceae bacterium]
MSDPDRRALAGLLGIGLAHDLRNLLSVAETSAYLATRTLEAEPARAATHLTRITEAVREAQSLLTATLAVSRGEPVSTEAWGASELVAAATRFVRGAEAVDVAPIAGELRVRAARALATAALVNVLKNAVEAAPSGVRVEARAGVDGMVEIVVSDEGPGFPEGFAITPGTTTKAHGHGIGLAAARAALESMGGSLELATGARGARVTLRLRAV